MPIANAILLRKLFMAFYFIVVIVVGLNLSPLRDILGHEFIPKYEIEYIEDYDGGNTSYFPDISTSHWYFTIIAHAIIPVFSIMLISLIIFLYIKLTKIIEGSRNIKKQL